MPAYNFQARFVTMILDGTKRQTIRRWRKRPTKSGDVLKLYTGMRTKACRLVKVVDCTSVVPVGIYPEFGQVRLNGRLLPLNEMIRFIEQDGFFDRMDEFYTFFTRYPQDVLDTLMEVIYWR